MDASTTEKKSSLASISNEEANSAQAEKCASGPNTVAKTEPEVGQLATGGNEQMVDSLTTVDEMLEKLEESVMVADEQFVVVDKDDQPEDNMANLTVEEELAGEGLKVNESEDGKSKSWVRWQGQVTAEKRRIIAAIELLFEEACFVPRCLSSITKLSDEILLKAVSVAKKAKKQAAEKCKKNPDGCAGIASVLLALNSMIGHNRPMFDWSTLYAGYLCAIVSADSPGNQLSVPRDLWPLTKFPIDVLRQALLEFQCKAGDRPDRAVVFEFFRSNLDKVTKPGQLDQRTVKARKLLRSMYIDEKIPDKIEAKLKDPAVNWLQLKVIIDSKQSQLKKMGVRKKLLKRLAAATAKNVQTEAKLKSSLPGGDYARPGRPAGGRAAHSGRPGPGGQSFGRTDSLHGFMSSRKGPRGRGHGYGADDRRRFARPTNIYRPFGSVGEDGWQSSYGGAPFGRPIEHEFRNTHINDSSLVDRQIWLKRLHDVYPGPFVPTELQNLPINSLVDVVRGFENSRSRSSYDGLSYGSQGDGNSDLPSRMEVFATPPAFQLPPSGPVASSSAALFHHSGPHSNVGHSERQYRPAMVSDRFKHRPNSPNTYRDKNDSVPAIKLKHFPYRQYVGMLFRKLSESHRQQGLSFQRSSYEKATISDLKEELDRKFGQTVPLLKDFKLEMDGRK